MKSEKTKRVVLVLFGLIVAVLMIEGLLRFLGWGFYYLQEKQNIERPVIVDIQQRRADGKEFVVLCLGESTTALKGKHSWPIQLQTILNNIQDERTFRVINKGVPATSTGIILRNLPEYLATHRPDLVLAMVGLNDFCTEPGSIFCSDYEALSSVPTITTTGQYRLEKLFNNFRTYGLIKWIAVGINTRVTGKGEDVMTAEVAQVGSGEAMPVYNLIHPDVTHLHSKTIHNLNAMVDITHERGANFIFVQYALRKIDILKDAIERDVFFFSNYEIFTDLLQKYDYGDLFTDRYAGDFGHATPFGNRVIADNVARQLLAFLESQEPIN